jgi:xanthine dehydrogenase accessory factor
MLDTRVVVRGGGDLGTGAAWRLRRSGFPVVVLELPRPLTLRRTVAFSTAVTEGSITVEGVKAVLVGSPQEALESSAAGAVAVLVSETMPAFAEPPPVLVDARLAKAPLDTAIDQAPLVVGLGPGLTAGVHCHAVVETNRGHRLGSVVWEGEVEPNTGIPGAVGGESARRVMRASRGGTVTWEHVISDVVIAGERLGSIDDEPVTAPIAGVIRGLIAEGPVKEGLKIGDIDPRADPTVCFEISDKSRAVAGGVLEAVMTWLSYS